ncbi:hypothetical protein NIES2135_66260 (plasmid) [Leptolyngbya boryana NIES-2135]|uniref:Uncharacterized protein n=2 Tax=Leptolyngbya group TaxID=3081713 RepID=A0A1Z4JSN5_LEPBY|nr:MULTISPECIES: hypothetical protein [Leptolyngbya]BAS59971.1 hypothetical protein LBWT_X0430 [Leptolyngbya boryana IAM M-101]BAY59749.1 hypothetical protein NIES2135_66260 [Leptolyngbya boryana NIES-2135]MBD2377018.1 hypothetical protein [Leptolyngbya sp. FACHB-238]MBD2407937.1 hypothetical protein [Leptolyngbya sp. FACHB-402]BAS66319.1 hypothetical protein LBDG_X0430 [Leptolyngbya boryana dg5]
MINELKILEELGFYAYEDPNLVPIIQALQIKNNSLWLIDGRYEQLEMQLPLVDNELMENIDSALYLYQPLPVQRCFSIDREDLYEYPPTIFENQYLNSSLKKCDVNVDEVDEYEDSHGNVHLITNLGDFLICPGKFRSSCTGTFQKWQVVISKSLAMLNELLSRIDSSERFYVLHEEDQERITIVLLNPALFDFLRATKKSEQRHLPQPIKEYFKNLSS